MSSKTTPTTIQPESVTKVPGRDKGKNLNDDSFQIIQWLTLPGQPKTKVYLSYRGIPLLCQEPSTFGKPIVTMENYCKWYSVEILYPDGRVESADPGLLDDIERRVGSCLMGDHNFHPRLLNELAQEIDGEADYRAIEMAGGRWVNEQMDGELEGFANFDIPRNRS